MPSKRSAPAPDDARQPKGVKAADFVSLYANVVKFLPTMLDMKVLFGTFEQNDDGVVVENHASVVMTWGVAKVMAVYLVLNLAIHEREHGVIELFNKTLQPDIKPFAEESIIRILEEAIKIRVPQDSSERAAENERPTKKQTSKPTK